MRTILIINPTSGASMLAANHGQTPEEHREGILAALRKFDLEAEVWETTPEDTGYGLAQKAAQEEAEIVIAAGGDGTLHAVASGLVGKKTTLGIIALGTMNNIARSLDIPEDVEKACEIIARGETCQMDVGKLNDHLFLEVAGIGLEAALFPAAEEFKSPGWINSLKGAVKGLATLLTFKPTRFRGVFDGRRERSFKAVQVSVCNTPYYGAHLRFAPNAVMNDGFLNVLIYRNFSKLEYLRHAISISQGRRVLEPKVRRRKIKSLTIYTDQPVEIHADGVAKGYTPATIVVEPGVLRIRVPKHIAAGPNIADEKSRRSRHYRKAQDSTLLEERDSSWQATPANH